MDSVVAKSIGSHASVLRSWRCGIFSTSCLVILHLVSPFIILLLPEMVSGILKSCSHITVGLV